LTESFSHFFHEALSLDSWIWNLGCFTSVASLVLVLWRGVVAGAVAHRFWRATRILIGWKAKISRSRKSVWSWLRWSIHNLTCNHINRTSIPVLLALLLFNYSCQCHTKRKGLNKIHACVRGWFNVIFKPILK
jgi:hypothetical protein